MGKMREKNGSTNNQQYQQLHVSLIILLLRCLTKTFTLFFCLSCCLFVQHQDAFSFLRCRLLENWLNITVCFLESFILMYREENSAVLMCSTTSPHPLIRFQVSIAAGCSLKPCLLWCGAYFRSKFIQREASYTRTLQRDEGAGWTRDFAILVAVKTVPLTTRPRRFLHFLRCT